MSIGGSVSLWLERLKSGDPEAAAEIWNRYYFQLVELARRKLRRGTGRIADEEDLVTNAFDSFFRRAQQGRFPSLHGRHELWCLLVKITERKLISYIRQQTRVKRGGGRVRGGSAFLAPPGQPESWDGCLPMEPSPEFAVSVIETFDRLLQDLDADLQQIVLLKLEGHTHEEIASTIQRSVATVERRLRLIRSRWEQELIG